MRLEIIKNKITDHDFSNVPDLMTDAKILSKTIPSTCGAVLLVIVLNCVYLVL